VLHNGRLRILDPDRVCSRQGENAGQGMSCRSQHQRDEA
jgi:hypothetical protein